MRIRIIVAAAMLLGAAGAATQYSTVKQAMLEAIDAPGGAVSGVVIGAIASEFRKTTQSQYPVGIEVATLKKFAEEGCRRLNVRLIQKVMTRDGELTDFFVNYELNLCRDGNPPSESFP